MEDTLLLASVGLSSWVRQTPQIRLFWSPWGIEAWLSKWREMGACEPTPHPLLHQATDSVSLSGEQPSLFSWARKEPGALDGGKKCREQNASPTGSSTSPPYLKLTPLHLHLLIWWYHLLRLWEIPGYKSSTDGLGFSFLGSAKLVTSKVFSGLLNSKILLGFSQVLILWTSLFSYVNELYLLGCFPLNQKPQFKVAFKKRK